MLHRPGHPPEHGAVALGELFDLDVQRFDPVDVVVNYLDEVLALVAGKEQRALVLGAPDPHVEEDDYNQAHGDHGAEADYYDHVP